MIPHCADLASDSAETTQKGHFLMYFLKIFKKREIIFIKNGSSHFDLIMDPVLLLIVFLFYQADVTVTRNLNLID